MSCHRIIMVSRRRTARRTVASQPPQGQSIPRRVLRSFEIFCPGMLCPLRITYAQTPRMPRRRVCPDAAYTPADIVFRFMYARDVFTDGRSYPRSPIVFGVLYRRVRCRIKEVPGAGLEPARGCPHWILSPARLPVSPPRHFSKGCKYIIKNSKSQVSSQLPLDFLHCPGCVFLFFRQTSCSEGKIDR